jgi:hypothetical protein
MEITLNVTILDDVAESNSERKSIRVDELEGFLRSLPLCAWPFGKVVAAQEISPNPRLNKYRRLSTYFPLLPCRGFIRVVEAD